MSFPQRPLLLGAIALSSSLGLTYILKNEIHKLNGPHQSLPSSSQIQNPYPVSRLYPTPSQPPTLPRDIETGLMLPPRMAMRAEEDDSLIENVVLYLG
ncbi:hypothetical protein V866_002875 [Kwoniella sp. B9012]